MICDLIGCDPCAWPRFQPACQSQPDCAASGMWERQCGTKKKLNLIDRGRMRDSIILDYLDSDKSLHWCLNDVQSYWLYSVRSGRGPHRASTPKKPGQRTNWLQNKKALWAWPPRRWARLGLWQHGGPNLPWHKKMFSCGCLWNKHRSRCCGGYRRSMRDEGASLGSSPLPKPGSFTGELSQIHPPMGSIFSTFL